MEVRLSKNPMMQERRGQLKIVIPKFAISVFCANFDLEFLFPNPFEVFAAHVSAKFDSLLKQSDLDYYLLTDHPRELSRKFSPGE